MHAKVSVLGHEVVLDCAACDARRLKDLAETLEARLASADGDGDFAQRLVLVALQLLDEAQGAGRGRARARDRSPPRDSCIY